jgi:hypothetical protein
MYIYIHTYVLTCNMMHSQAEEEAAAKKAAEEAAAAKKKVCVRVYLGARACASV